MASQAQQSSVKFIAIGRLGHSELLDYHTPTGELENDQLVEECLKVLAENQLNGNSTGDLHFHALKHEDLVVFIQHGNTRLDELFELKVLEELNLQWNSELKLTDFMAKLAEKPKKITRPPLKVPRLPSQDNKSHEVMPTASTNSDFTLTSHRKAPTATSSVDQIKLMMAEDQRFKARAANPAVEAIKLAVVEDQKNSANTPKTDDTTTQRSSNKETPGGGSSGKTKEGLVILGAESETKAESSTESAVVAEELKKIKQASTNKKIFVVVILILAVVVFALVPVLTT